ncbi:hypothetical protein [Cupriavidus sp. 2SB]|uniref:hypothetical protein n=1 Tax=Cupriavidus sp. 2SB TaxID=2502199 RepID=UPI0010F590A3|nr:hypothetical protein [Cupriavidus sp. 2SB]
MLIPPQLRPGVVAPPRPHHPPVIRYRIRGIVLLLRLLMLCLHAAALADSVLPPPSVQRPGFLEDTAAHYAHSDIFNAVEGIAPVRPGRMERSEPSAAQPVRPASPTPPTATTLAPAPANVRRVKAP